MSDQRTPKLDMNRRIARLAFGSMALFAVLAGLALWQFSDVIGLERDTAKLIATVFVIAGIGDVVVLYFWDRLFKDKG